MMMMRYNLYSVFLHIMVLGLASLVVALILVNRQLRRPALTDVEQLARGDSVQSFNIRHLDDRSDVLQWTQMERERLLFVFTTRCPACQENQEAWIRLYTKTARKFDIVGISLDDIGLAKAYRDANELPFSVVVPEDLTAFNRAYEVSAVPLTIHVGRDGKVLNTWLGGLSEQNIIDLMRYESCLFSRICGLILAGVDHQAHDTR